LTSQIIFALKLVVNKGQHPLDRLLQPLHAVGIAFGFRLGQFRHQLANLRRERSVSKILPDTRTSAQGARSYRWQQRRLGVLIFQILSDYCRVINRGVFVDQDGYASKRVKTKKVWAPLLALAEIDGDEFVR
jgi:hypothetical protein